MTKIFTNRRKKNIFNNNLYLIFIFIFMLFFLLCVYFNLKLIKDYSVNFIESFSYKYNYQLTEINVSNLKYLKEEDVLFFFNSHMNKSIFLVPIQSIAKDIVQDKWVEKIKIISNFKDTLKVSLQEEIPMGIYDNNNQKILFSQNFVILEILDAESNYTELIVFFGENSISNSKNFFSDIEKNFHEFIKTATFIENRRWNIVLTNSILLKLPEKNVIDAINNYKKIYSNFSNKDLEDIKSIDLRINKQAIIKYKNIND